MRAFVLVIIGLYASSIPVQIMQIGKERKPIDATLAAWTCFIYLAICVWGVTLL